MGVITGDEDPPRYDWRREVEAKRPADDPARADFDEDADNDWAVADRLRG